MMGGEAAHACCRQPCMHPRTHECVVEELSVLVPVVRLV
jgi:hypothetical protein